MKKHAKSVISALLAVALFLTILTSATMFMSGMEAEAATRIEAILDSGSRKIDLNEDWQFFLATRTPSVASGSGGTGFANNGLADAGGLTTAQAIDPAFDDNSWRTVTVPHDFSIEGPRDANNDQQGNFRGGLGWYRKTFTLPATLSGKNIAVDFEGVYQNSIVYLNGEVIGNYPSGYTGFSYDLTSKLNFGADNPNVLVVKVQNMSSSGRWYTGSGIVRPVALVVTDKATSIVRHGVTLTSETLETTYKNDGSAVLDVKVKAFSRGNTAEAFSLKTIVKDPEGKVVATKTGTAATLDSENSIVTLTDAVAVPAVELWYTWDTGDQPLYTVTTELYLGVQATPRDSIDTTYGFRWFRFDPRKVEDPTYGGFHINDKYIKLQGVDLHHDLGALGGISSPDAFEYRFEKLMDMGVNAYRTSHNPPSKQIIEACNKMGIVVMEEAYDSWGSTKATYDFGLFYNTAVPQDWKGFAVNGFANVPTPSTSYVYNDTATPYCWSEWVIQEMVRRDINDCSIIMWSVGNELWNAGTRPAWYDATKYDPLGVKTSATASDKYTEVVRLRRNIEVFDKTRVVTYGTASQRNNNGTASNEETWMNTYLGSMGVNYNQAISLDSYAANFPNTFWMETESASYTSSRGVYFDPKLLNTGINYTPGKIGGSNYDNDFQSWTLSSEYNIKKDRDRKFFAGQYIWTGIDYIGETTPYESVSTVGNSSFGVIDTAGFPKDSFYMYKSQWTKEPMVHILPGNWDMWRKGETVSVWAYSNVRTVELFLNGKSLGTKSFDVKKTNYGQEYYETSEYIADDKTWGNNDNPGGYISEGATVVSAGGDSPIAAGAKFGRLHLTWEVPYEKGVLEAVAYTGPDKQTEVARHVVSSSEKPYTFETNIINEVIKADGQSLSFIEVTIVDENGNEVPYADNLMKFDVAGGAIVGVDNGAQESMELFKWGNVERNTHSERKAYMGKALVIVQSNKGGIGTMKVAVSSDKMISVNALVAVTADGTGNAPAAPGTVTPVFSGIEEINLNVPVGVLPMLPAYVNVTFTDANGGYTVQKPVTWESISGSSVSSMGHFTVKGDVEGIADKAIANVSVLEVGEKRDISTNTTLGNNNRNYTFTGLAASSTVRNGAIATADFTGNNSRLPNNMLNGNATQYWSNEYSRSATIILPIANQSRMAETVEFLWDGPRALNEVRFNFTTNATCAIPETFQVQYYDGEKWIDAENQETVKATASGGITSVSFDALVADRVRVYMTNATPYTATGNMRITAASVMGWNLAEAIGVSLNKAEMVIPVGKEETLSATILPPDEADGKTILWDSSNPTAVSVDGDGKITANAEGTATITATTEGSINTAACAVTVAKLIAVNTGETVSIPITVKDCQGLAGVKGTLAYDEDLLTLEGIAAQTGFVIQSAGDMYVAVTTNGKGLDGDVVIGYAIMTAKADLNDDVTTLLTFPKEAYTGYNETGETISLTVPPILVAIVGLPPMRGDVNLDGEVDLADAILLMQYLSGNNELTARQLKAADVSNDGIVNVGDTIIIMQMCLQ